MSAEDAHAVASDRRWLIGISISIFFGLFGAVMAVLAYRDRGGRDPAPNDVVPTVVGPKWTQPTPVASTAVAPTPTPAPTNDDHDKGDKKKHHK